MMTIQEVCKATVETFQGDKKAAAKELGVPLPMFYGLLSGKINFDVILKIANPDPVPAKVELAEAVKPELTDEKMLVEYSDGILNASFCPAEWGKKKAAWEGRDVCLCLPTYKMVPEEFLFNMLALALRYRQALRVEHRGGDSMITRSRNQLAKRFLDTGATWSVWFDSDMVFPLGHAGVYLTMTGMRHVPEQFLKVDTIERLISRGRSLVGGCYWDRRGSGRLVACGSTPILAPIPSDNLAPVDFVGTGCWAVNRKVFLDIAAKFPQVMSKDSFGNETGFFTNIQTDNRMMGEDESFAWRAKEAGHPSFLDLGTICGHIGNVIHGMPATGSRI